MAAVTFLGPPDIWRDGCSEVEAIQSSGASRLLFKAGSHGTSPMNERPSSLFFQRLTASSLPTIPGTSRPVGTGAVCSFFQATILRRLSSVRLCLAIKLDFPRPIKDRDHIVLRKAIRAVNSIREFWASDSRGELSTTPTFRAHSHEIAGQDVIRFTASRTRNT